MCVLLTLRFLYAMVPAGLLGCLGACGGSINRSISFRVALFGFWGYAHNPNALEWSVHVEAIGLSSTLYRTLYIVGGKDKTNFSRMGMHSVNDDNSPRGMRNGDELDTKILFSLQDAS